MAPSNSRRRGDSASLRHYLEFLPLWVVVKLFGLLPRRSALQLGELLGRGVEIFLKRLRQVGMQNLTQAFPSAPLPQLQHTLHRVYGNLGRHLAEFCKMPSYLRAQASEFIRYEGLEHYLSARDRGRGVLVLTGHLGAWELSCFYHSLVGYPMGLLIRRLDNPLVDRMVNRIRCLHGNRVIDKDDFARGLISAMRAGETVGILMDTNMTPPQGVFVPFFGREACTGSGLARIAMKTGAAVLPGFLLRDGETDCYKLRFGKEISLVNSGNLESDIRENTAAFTRIIEEAVRSAPDQWLWMHRRWKTRPAGEARIY